MAQLDFAKENGLKLVVIKSMPQTLKTIILRGMPSFANPIRRTSAMLKAEIALGEFMIQHRGDYGTVQMPNGTVISKIAFDAGKALAGANYGGLSYLDRLSRHQAPAESNINRLKKILANKAVTGNGRSGKFMGE